MSLQEKILRLKLNAALSLRVADTWQRAINVHGEEQATAFYSHLGLNHLEKKGFDFEGLTLSREPKEHEKIAVKGIHQAQELAKESITKILLDLRTELISDGLKGIKKLKPAKYHELILQASPDSRQSLRDRLMEVHKRGRMLIAQELGKKSAPHGHHLNNEGLAVPCECLEIKAVTDDDEFEDLDLLTDLSNGRVVNDVQSRIIASAQRFALLGQTGNTLLTSVTSEIANGSVGYVDRAATGVANTVISIGRSDEAESRSDDWERIEYSALLDQNVCSPCSSADGETATNESDLTPAPNPDCAGGDWCRCFHVYITV